MAHNIFELSLLLSALQKYGIDQTSFQRISTELTQNDVVVEDSAFDAARFAPESLQSLYLQVLQDEVRAASAFAAQQAKRKKSPTPPLRNLTEAGNHKHLLPGLASRYHAQYVAQVTKEILEDEKTYDELVEEIRILESQPKDVQTTKNTPDAAQAQAGASLIDGHSRDLTAKQSSVASDIAIPLQPFIANQPSSNTVKESNNAQPPSQRRSPTPGYPFPTAQQQANGTDPGQFNSGQQVEMQGSKPATTPAVKTPGNTGQISTKSPSTPVAGFPRQHGPATTNSPNTAYATPNFFPPSSKSTSALNQPNAFYGTFQATPPVAPPNSRPLPASFTPLPPKVLNFLSTPLSSFSRRQSLSSLKPLQTSSTKWKDPPRNATKEGRSPPRPGNSPYLSDSPSPSPERVRPSSDETARGNDTLSRGRGRGKWPARGRGRGGRLTTTSPGIGAGSARGRSQSALSGAEDSAAEGTIRKMKTEPPATPGLADDNLVSTPGDSRPGARRRDILRDGETPKPSLKRKRADTADGTPEVTTAPKFSRPGQVLASRNFPRIVSALLNDINSHKLASVFAKPITEKSAPGYQSLIYRPQDLKSIRSAISAGSRFVAQIQDPETTAEATTGGDTPVAATPSAGSNKATNIWVDRTVEVIPPKGIVNSAQLEKELCRMLANAVMYNPDPRRSFGPHFKLARSSRRPTDGDEDMEDEHDPDDGRVVNDAREMFTSVEQAVAAWRAAERVNAGDTSNKAGIDKSEEQAEDAGDNTGEEGDGEKGSLRRSARS